MNGKPDKVDPDDVAEMLKEIQLTDNAIVLKDVTGCDDTEKVFRSVKEVEDFVIDSIGVDIDGGPVETIFRNIVQLGIRQALQEAKEQNAESEGGGQ